MKLHLGVSIEEIVIPLELATGACAAAGVLG
jgi:hypothetical protein